MEGDSDELVVQRAYMDAHGGRLPIQDGIDVISVGTAFLRFLELAKALKIPVAVVTDNDGDTAAVEKKYAAYKGESARAACRSGYPLDFGSQRARRNIEGHA